MGGRTRSLLRICLTTVGDTTTLLLCTAGPGDTLYAVLCRLRTSRHIFGIVRFVIRMTVRAPKDQS